MRYLLKKQVINRRRLLAGPRSGPRQSAMAGSSPFPLSLEDTSCPLFCSRSSSKDVALRGAQITWTGYEPKPSAGVRINQDSSRQVPRSLCLMASQDQPHNSIASLIKNTTCLSGGLYLALGSLLGLCARSGLQSEVWQAILETEVMALGKEALAEGESGLAIDPHVGRGVLNVRCVQTAAGAQDAPSRLAGPMCVFAEQLRGRCRRRSMSRKHRRLTSSWGGTTGH